MQPLLFLLLPCSYTFLLTNYSHEMTSKNFGILVKVSTRQAISFILLGILVFYICFEVLSSDHNDLTSTRLSLSLSRVLV